MAAPPQDRAAAPPRARCAGRSSRRHLVRPYAAQSDGSPGWQRHRVAQLRAAHDNDRARAVVLRVESPGGSAVASEVIWREVWRLRESGKPVVVSMGDVAASGGYYIASPAEVIVALPATLTGSIGVSGGKLVVDGLLERVGVTTGSVQRGARALMYSPGAGLARTSGHGSRRPSTLSTTTSWEGGCRTQAPVAEIEAVARGRVDGPRCSRGRPG